MAVTWNTPAGTLGTLNERTKQNIVLSASSGVSTVTYKLISGSLPLGLRLENNAIVGTPFEVKKPITSRFVIRASDSVDKKDRTFEITVIGADAPYWVTPDGLLPVGPNYTYFVLDNDKVDFQLLALDPDIPAGDKIEYYIPFDGGELPPGLTLSSTGRISGFTKPIFALENKIYNSNYDRNLYDSEPYDLGALPINGFDSFGFDVQTFDYFDAVMFPRKLTRFYQFVVVASDGLHDERRTFKIYVVSEDFLKSDNTIMQVGTGIFRADNTYVRAPIWITEPDLGTRRANNYVTLNLEVFHPDTWPGTITFRLNDINPQIRAETLSIVRDTDTYVDVQIKPTVAGDYPVPKKTQLMSVYDVATFTDSTLGSYSITNIVFQGNNKYRIYVEPRINGKIPKGSEILFGTPSIVPKGMVLDTIVGKLTGKVPYQPRITETFEFSVVATTTYPSGTQASSIRTFTIKTIGELETGIKWISSAELGSISPNKNSQLVIEAESLLRNGLVTYQLVPGKGVLPPGLTLLSTGEIIGKVRQIGTFNSTGFVYDLDGGAASGTGNITVDNGVASSTSFLDLDGNTTTNITPGLTRFYNYDGSSERDFNVTFDNTLTSFDKEFTFVVAARDIYNYSSSSKTFKIVVSGISDVVYSNLSFKVLQKKSKRDRWYTFISDTTIFNPEKIYRYGDPAFGIQDSLTMLVYAGIQSSNIDMFVEAVSRNHYNKRLKFGDIKKAVAKDPTTQEIIYEVVYVDVVDDLVKNGKSISRQINLPDNINRPVRVDVDTIKVDSNNFLVSDRDIQTIWPNSIKNMRKRIKSTGLNDRTYLPLWMRSIQESSFVEPGWVSAMPICYCLPGSADDIIVNIKNLSDFDFKTIDFEVDRYLIDSTDGILQDKYLAFPQRGEII